jgi:starch synthase
MQSMRYGTLPLVTDVGGLHDTVIDVDDLPTRGTGIVVPTATSVALMDGLHRIVKAQSQARRRSAMQRRGMSIDWSWKKPAAAHVEWYRRLVREGSSVAVSGRV